METCDCGMCEALCNENTVTIPSGDKWLTSCEKNITLLLIFVSKLERKYDDVDSNFDEMGILALAKNELSRTIALNLRKITCMLVCSSDTLKVIRLNSVKPISHTLCEQHNDIMTLCTMMEWFIEYCTMASKWFYDNSEKYSLATEAFVNGNTSRHLDLVRQNIEKTLKIAEIIGCIEKSNIFTMSE